MSTFHLHLSWHGSTATPGFSRNADATAHDKVRIALSSGAGEGVDPSKWNPEDLFGAAMAQCHTLTFLALAAKVKLDVVRIETDVEVELVDHERSKRIGRVVLRPRITLAAGDAAKAAEMYEKAHKYCYVANSTTAEVVMEPDVRGPQTSP